MDLGRTGRCGALVALLAGFASSCPGFDEGASDITAVSSRVSADYQRGRQADGTFVPETYAFGKGGAWEGSLRDYSIDKLSFLDVAHVIALPLAGQHYFPSRDPATAKLLIMVYWGTTHAPEHANDSNGMVELQNAFNLTQVANGKRVGSPWVEDEISEGLAVVQAENKARDQADLINIRMLGYDSWLEKFAGDLRGTAIEQGRRDLYDEIEQNRYFVVLMAYDFQVLSRERLHRLLWETRFSIRQQHHEFEKELPALALYASRYFGQDSHGLVHDKIPQGQVDVGDVKSLGEVLPPK
ncbi:MAG TPA: hypothetical protein VGF85_00120 [Opitutaceae bacterium]|jgi:hypothetical protein